MHGSGTQDQNDGRWEYEYGIEHSNEIVKGHKEHQSKSVTDQANESESRIRKILTSSSTIPDFRSM